VSGAFLDREAVRDLDMNRLLESTRSSCFQSSEWTRRQIDIGDNPWPFCLRRPGDAQ
jgi:hypothetical protein